MFLAGFGKADITPPIGLPLSGFAVRKNRPSEAVDDPLQVKALVLVSSTALEAGDECCLLLSYDLLGFDAGLDQQVREQVQESVGARVPPGRILVTTTHTHSGPTTMPIAGESRAPDSYIQKILQATGDAARQALGSLEEVELFHASAALEGINHNRRQRYTPRRADEEAPLDKTFDLFAFKRPDNPSGDCVGSLVRFSCHAVTMTTQHISADFPGELTHRLEDRLGGTCLFLEGTAGDTNPTTHGLDHTAMLGFVDKIMAQIEDLPGRLSPVPVERVRAAQRAFPLPLALFPARESVLEKIAKNDRILAGDFTSPDLQPLVNEYSGWRHAWDTDIAGAVLHWAEVYRDSARRTLAAVEDPAKAGSVPFRAAALELGPLLFVFLTGEILTPVGQHIQALAPDRVVKVISYLSPIVGYIASAEEYASGGYELDNAWMWYGLPGPFDPGVEKVILEQVRDLFEND